MSIPNHVAIIPDGNRRWAKNKGLPVFVGHQNGAKKFEEILQKALELNIKFLTFWGASFDNITKRDEDEVACLFEIFEDYFKRLINEQKVHENKVRIIILGRWREVFPESLKIVINDLVEKTKGYNNHCLTFLMAYNGDDEIVDCISKLKEAGIEVNHENIKKNLWTSELPSVDMLIRTGCNGDPHNSAGFMMWDTAYSQLAFPSEFFPDYSSENFEKTIKNFADRERRKGR
ncbi:polyprenyl diphosphate synthase [bacterium]|nr:polyprenyl diphosphate synthase [bacterium]